jgi:hypothetical protein
MPTTVAQEFRIASSSGRGAYTVQELADGSWRCACPAWTRHTPRRDCKHIAEARTMPSGMTPGAVDALLTLAMVDAVTAIRDDTGALRKIYVPLLPLGPEWMGFWVTIAYDLLRLGVAWRRIAAHFKQGPTWTAAAISAYIAVHGRTVMLPSTNPRSRATAHEAADAPVRELRYDPARRAKA